MKIEREENSMNTNISIEDLKDVITNNYYKGAEAVINAITEMKTDDKVMLSTLNPGDMFTDKDGDKYIVFAQNYDVTFVLRKDLLPEEYDMKFDSNDNNFDTSEIKEWLNTTYLEVLEKKFGAENILTFNTDLFSHDGFDDYGLSENKVSLLTFDQYRENREIIGEDMPRWWWLSTPNSTPSGCGSGGVRYVYSDGDVGYCWCNGVGAVRPFCLLKSSIFVSPRN